MSGWGSWSAGFMVAGVAAGGLSDTGRPNIVLMIGDDISPDFGCYGGDALTPNIDRLARGGIRFDNFFVTASSCSPSRSSMITGRYPHNTGAPELHMELPAGHFLFPEALKRAGYYCVQAGKWHMGAFAKQAFDDVYERADAGDAGWSDRFVRCLQDRPKDRPFFAWFASFDAHRPWQPDPLTSAPDPDRLRLFAGIPDTPAARQDLASYLHEVQRFDRYVGMVTAELREQGVLENTLFMVLADNGRPFPRNKTTLYDNGMKVPLVIHWPGGQIAAGAVSSSLVSGIDLAPAVLEAAGLPVPAQVQGISVLPVCRNPELTVREMIFGERNWHVQRACARMVRTGDYLYIRNFWPQFYSFQMVDHKDGAYAELLRLRTEGALSPEQAEEFSTDMPREMLFRIGSDPQQLCNLAANPECRPVLDRLRRVLNDWQLRTGDSIPAPEEMTPDRMDVRTFQPLYPGARPPGGIPPGRKAGAEQINDSGEPLRRVEDRRKL